MIIGSRRAKTEAIKDIFEYYLIVFNADELETIRKLLDEIDPREADVLRLRYGIDEDEPLTLKEIGKRVGLTRERVRQIEKETLAKLQATLTSEP